MTPSRQRSEDAREVLVGEVADEFTDRLRRGERPEVEEYVRRHPALAEELRDVLGALVAMRQPLPPQPQAGRTEPHRPPDAAGSRAPREGYAPPVGGGGFRPIQPLHLDLPSLLRRRLRILVLIGLVFFGLFHALRIFRLDFSPHDIWFTMVPGVAFLGAEAALAVILWSKRPLPLSGLRILEGCFFGLVVVFFAWENWTTLFSGRSWFPVYAQRHPAEMSILARQPGIMWAMLILGYGTFIPNTGRRCAAVTGLMALVPLAVVWVGGACYPQVPRHLLLLFLTEMALWLGMATGAAIFGSHKVSTLSQQALEARKLGPYRLKRRLGAGGMGEVYLAEHVLLRRPCAVKLIRPERAGDPGTLRRFLREVQVTATLTHPNTVQVFDYGQTEDGTLYYAMEHLCGPSLEELVARHGPQPPARVVFLLRQMCGALAEAHAAGLVHRDIKPGNVMLCSRGGMADVAKLLDFGLVHQPPPDGDVSRLTRPGLIFGTPAYMSPEQAAARADVDGRSDLYSLGALAYFLLTGQPPFVRAGAVQTLAAHLGEPLQPTDSFRARVPADVQAVVVRCLAKDPAGRFPDAHALDEALAGCACAGQWGAGAAAAWWQTQAPAGPTAL
jgi:serine/threonine-protein kinase